MEKFGEHYAKHQSVIGWQIDNEINCEVDEFYSESDTLAFREFLKEKYETLDALNQAWGGCVLESRIHQMGRNLCAKNYDT